jgi:hypothetical protein
MLYFRKGHKMNIVHKSLLSAVALLGAAALAFSIGMVTPVQASGAHEVKLADAQEAKALCDNKKVGNWDIAVIIGPPGMAQYGPGYGCKQAVEKVSGLGNAIEAGKGECKLATAQKAKALCTSKGVGNWDIAVIIGPPGMAQYGPGYGCKQAVEKVSGLGNAICE